jgi:hypothetical protein
MQEGMRIVRRWKILGFIGVLGVITLWSAPSSRAATGTIDRFVGASEIGGLLDEETMASLLEQVSEDSIRAHVEHLVYKDPSRPYDNSYDNLRTRFALRPETFEITTYLRDQLTACLGEEAVKLLPFTVDHGDSTYTIYNVEGTLKGTDPSAGYYVVSAHYDATARRTEGWNWRTEPTSGADDNATGVALMLESARVLSSQRFPWTIRFVGFSGEELHLLGSKDYARKAFERGDRILGALNFDMIGYNRLVDRIHLVANPASRWIVDTMRVANERYGIGLMVDVVVDHRFFRSDHASFWFQGYDAILGIENYPPETTPDSTLYIPYSAYDTVADVADSVNFRLVRKCTQLCVAALGTFQTLRNAPADQVIAYPNPLVVGEGREMTFIAPRGSRVELLSLAGEPIWTGTVKIRDISWDGSNESGYLVGSGIYFYLVTQPDGGVVARGKIGVVRE